MFWADKIVKEIIDSGKYKPYWVDDMKTPSGYAHIGSLRGPFIHSLVYRALKDVKVPVTFTYVFNDFDPADEFPPEFKKRLAPHAGEPLKTVPSPDTKFENLADLLADDLKQILVSLGVEAKFLSSWEMYHGGKFDGVIREALDNSDKIQDIYQRVSGSAKKEKGWLPFQVVCEKCGKLGTTQVFDWDGKEVSYKCEENLVTWAKGCGHEGKISPFGGTGKLPWKVDWAAHWKVIGVTVEGAGKDHGSAGGSYDIAMTLCDEIFKYPQPYKFVHEFFLIGGKKMSSSKGLGAKAHDITKFLPGEVARFLFARTDYREAIDFDPNGTDVIPHLFDEYDKAWKAYVDGSNPDLARAFELSQIKEVPDKKEIFLPRFRDVVNYLQQPGINLIAQFSASKGDTLKKEELEILQEREKYAKVWLENYAPEEEKIEFKDKLSDEVTNLLSAEQKKYLAEIVSLIKVAKDPEELQKQLYEKTKEMGIPTKQAFAAVYQVTIGRDHGPKAAWLLLSYPKEKVVERLKEAST